MLDLDLLAGRTPQERAAFWDAYMSVTIWWLIGGSLKLAFVALAYWILLTGGWR